MINLFKKKISKKWVALTTLILGLFWKVGSAKAVVGYLAVGAGIVVVETVMQLIFGKTLTEMSLQALIGGIITLLIYTVGGVLTVLIWILFQAAKYNDFVNSPVVIGGWVVVRDISNMFFILILLIIAFATILRIESYSWKKNLPKLLIMAILINFSKTICGLVIDFGQVIMLTFVNAFGDAGPGNLVNTFGIEKLYSLSLITNKDVSALGNLGGLLLGLMMLIITSIVVGIFVAILVYRIVMLWILIVLSPLAFLAMAIPAGAKYASQWSGDFFKYIVIGPVMAFFLWLALLYGSSSSIGVDLSQTKDSNIPHATISDMGKGNNMQRFIIAIALLFGGLMMAQQMGGAVGSVAGKGMDWAKKVASVPHWGLRVARDYPIDYLQRKGIVDLNLARVWKGIKEKRENIKRKQYGEGMVAAAEQMKEGPKYFKRTLGRTRGWLAATATPGSAFEELTTAAGWKRRIMGGRYAKGKINDLDKEREQAKTDIKNIKNTDEYKEAMEISETLAPAERQNLDNEQTQLTNEIEQLNNEIKSLAKEIKDAKNNNDFIAERNATEKSDNLKDQLELKLSTFGANKKTLDQKPYTGDQIFDAKAKRASLENQISEKKKIIDFKNDQILKYKPIVDFEAIAMQGALEAEEMKKVEHIKDRDELASMLRDAMKAGNKTRFSSIALKLAKDGNENDGVLNNLGFTSNAFGLQDMIKSISSREYKNSEGQKVKSNNYIGFSDQQAKALGMKIAYAAEGNNHWATARAFTMEDGRYRDSSKYEQAIAAASEIAKMDPQQIASRLNRLGYGGETPDGKFILNELGLAILKAVGPKVAEQMNRFNPNAAPRLSEPENIKLMIDVGVAPEFISKLQVKGRTPMVTVEKAIDQLREKGYFKK